MQNVMSSTTELLSWVMNTLSSGVLTHLQKTSQSNTTDELSHVQVVEGVHITCTDAILSQNADPGIFVCFQCSSAISKNAKVFFMLDRSFCSHSCRTVFSMDKNGKRV